MDFMKSTMVDDPQMLDRVTYDSCVSLLTHLHTLVNSKYDTYLATGIQATRKIFYRLQELVTTTTLCPHESSEQKAALCV